MLIRPAAVSAAVTRWSHLRMTIYFSRLTAPCPLLAAAVVGFLAAYLRPLAALWPLSAATTHYGSSLGLSSTYCTLASSLQSRNSSTGTLTGICPTPHSFTTFRSIGTCFNRELMKIMYLEKPRQEDATS